MNPYAKYDSTTAAGGISVNPYAKYADNAETDIVDKIKNGLSTTKDYGLTVVSGAGEGVASTEAGIGTFIQAPVANTLSAVAGGRALADRGITAAANWVSPDSAKINPDYQASAQSASRFAADARKENASASSLARLGLNMQDDGRERVKAIQDFNQENNPELVRQQQSMAQTQGFFGALQGITENPMAFTHTMARSAPDMAIGGAIAKSAAAGISALGGSAARQIAGASVAGIAAEAGSSALMAREGVYQQVLAKPIESLAASDRFNEILRSTGDATVAREILANELADQAPLLAGAGTALGSVAANKLFGGDASAAIIAGTTKTSGKDVFRNIAQEGTEEALQGVPEDLAQHGAVVQADPAQEFDLGKTIAENAVAGAAMGGGGSFAAYAKDRFSKSAPPQAAPPQLPDTGPLSRGANISLATAAGELLGEAGTAVPEPLVSEAEAALYSPKNLSSLDRVAEIDAILPAALPDEAVALQSERDSITQAWPKSVVGGATTFSTESGARLSANYALMDAAELTTSHDENLRPTANYPAELQPRARDRAASEVQVSGIVQKLDPARLGLSADAANGAPIVGADGLVESGNARTIALKRVYLGNAQKADEYKRFLKENAAQFGITPESVDAMQKPVLVRVRNTPVNRAEFARQANASTVAQMSPSETAKSDAARMDVLDDLRPDENGDFSTSRDFIRRFVAKLPGTEQAGMMDAGGQLSQTGYARVRNAVLAKAYGDSPVLVRMVESMDDNLRNVGKALMASAPAVAKARQAIAEGVLFDADITPELMTAVEGLSRIKDSGQSVSEALSQAGIFGDRYSPETHELIQFLADNMRKPRVMAEFVQGYMEALTAAGNPNQGSIFGETTAPTKGALLSLVKGKLSERTSESISQATRQQPVSGQPGGSESAGPQGGEQPADAQGHRSSPPEAGAANERIDQQWRFFPPESGTLGIPRAQMPQVAIALRPAMLDFMQSRGVGYERLDVEADALKPTQAEYSLVKTDRARTIADDRSDKSAVLVSSDNYVLDGHHRWIAKAQEHQPVNAIRFDAPIARLLDVVREFSGTTTSNDSGALLAKRAQAVGEFYDAASDLANILSKHTRAAMLPENLPGLMPTLVKLFDAAFDVVGTDLKRATAWVKDRLKSMPEMKTKWNKIFPSTYKKAALQAIEQYDPDKREQGDLFLGKKSGQMDMFVGKNAAPKVAMIDGRPYAYRKDDDHGDNFNPGVVDDYISADVLERADEYVRKYYSEKPDPVITQEERNRALDLLTPLIKRAEDAKPGYDQKVIDIARRSGAIGQQLAPVKGLKRAIPKLVKEEKFDVEGMKDMLRSTIVVSSYEDAQRVVDEIEKEFDLLRNPKNRTGRTPLRSRGKDISPEDNRIYGGYADILVNVVLPGNVIAEIQINIPSMLAAKEAQGHKLYEAFRDAPKDSPLGREINAAMQEFYAAAFAARRSDDSFQANADARNAASSDGNSDSDLGKPLGTNSPASDIPNTLPSGNTTRSSPPKESKNSQPAGNLSGTFISPTSNSSIAKLGENGYTESGNKSIGQKDGHAKHGARGAEGKESGALFAAGEGGNADGLRAGTGGGNQRADSDVNDEHSVKEGLLQTAVHGPAKKGRNNENGRQPGKRNRVERNAGIPAGRDIPVKSGRNYAFGEDDLTYEGGWFSKAKQNVEAVELFKALQADGRMATREEQQKLAKFIGWGSSEIANSIFGDKLSKQLETLALYDEAIANLVGKPSLTNRVYSEYAPAFKVLQTKNPALNWYSAGNITREMLDSARPDVSVRKWGTLRDRLKAVLSEEEWASASRSTQYAHYTSKPVVKSLLAAVEKMGFKGGTILEPGAGIGVFPGLMNSAMANNSIYTGIEFEPVTGGILKQLFPDERILVESFIDSKLPENYYDVAFGNPPFGGFKVLGDPKYAKHAFALHDYFFAKSLDSVKPGGLLVFVTSRYTMDKAGDKARKYMAERADLVGAIRLPQTAFQKNAGTEVVTDVLFLRKKVPGQTFGHAQAWGGLGEVKTDKAPAMVNEYFAAHPEMVLGEHSRQGSMYGKEEYTVMPKEGDIEAQFAAATENLPANVFVPGRGSAAEAAKVQSLDFDPKAKKEGSFYVTGAGVLMQREGGVGVRAEEKHQKNAAVIKDYIGLRDAVKQSQLDQLADGDWEASLKALQKVYRDFVKKNGRLLQNTSYMQKVQAEELDDDGIPTGNKVADEELRRRFPLQSKLQDDPEYTLVSALEDLNEETGEITETGWLTKRTLGAPTKAEIQTPADALLASLDDTGVVDIEAIADMLGISEHEAVDALGSLVYEDPSLGWQMADEYLSGNVKKKLHVAEEVAKGDKRYARNVEALKAVQPTPRAPGDITPQIGMNWIPGEYYTSFIKDLAGVEAKVEYNERTKEWIVSNVSRERTTRATVDWGVGERENAAWLLGKALTSAPIRLSKSVSDGNGGYKPVFDPDRTEAAQQKRDEMQKEFRSWLFQDAGRAEKIGAIYNDKFNTTVQRKFDGRHLTLPGTSKLYDIFDHVKRGAWRIIQSGNTYLAHAVGSGKTFEMVISAMEQKRLGLIKKPMIIVPGHMLQQFASEWQQLYPTARLMVADEKGFHSDNRRKFVSRVAMSDLDGVIMTHSSFKLLDLDPEFKQKMINQELEFMRASYEEAGGDLDDIGDKKVRKDPKVKRIEAQIERLQQELAKAMSSEGKDKNVRFDEMGVDMLYVDEAHLFRKLTFASNRQMKGIDPSGSQMAWDLYMKTRWLAQKNPTRNLVMASGTPITNTTAELYTVQRYMAPQVLEENGLSSFDDWASQFGEESTEIESTSSGKYEPVTRFANFVNVGEMTQMFRDFADVLNEDHLAALLGDKRPKVAGGTRKSVITPKTESYKQFLQDTLIPRVEASKKWKPSFQEANNPDPIININTDARLAAIDMRFMNPSLPSDPDSKLNQLIDGVIRVYKETADNRYYGKDTKDENGKKVQGPLEPLKGATQMVFYESGFGRQAAINRGFSARAWMEKRLRDAGIPTSQVAFMEDYKKSSAKLKLFHDVNTGKVRVLVGSSAAMGTGVNAQQRLIAMHHIDAPLVPAVLEQREGRIIRQGNKNPSVQIYAYSMFGSFDENQWTMLARKKFFIEQAMSGDPNIRSIEDVGEVSNMQQLAGMIAENPYVMAWAGAKGDVEKLTRLNRSHEEARGRMFEDYTNAGRTIEMNEKALPVAEREAAKVQVLTGNNFVAKANGETFDKRKEWGEAVMASAKALSDKLQEGKPVKVGEISGFDVMFQGRMSAGSYLSELYLPLHDSAAILSHGAGGDAVSLAIRATSLLSDVSRRVTKMRNQIEEAKNKRDALSTRLDAPFPLAEQLANKLKEVADLEDKMAAYGKETTGNDADTEGNSSDNNVHSDINPDRWSKHHADAAASRAIDLAIAREQGHPVAPTRKPAVLARLKKILDSAFSGEYAEGRVFNELSFLTQHLMNASAEKKYAPVNPRIRGADFFRQKLLEAKRQGNISAQEADFAEWLALKNPELLDDLAVSIRTAKDGDGAGNYNPATRMVTLFKDHSADTTAVHEVLHHLERMLPENLRAPIMREYLKRIASEMKTATGKRKEMLTAIMEANAVPSRAAVEKAVKLMEGYADYHLLNASEFWAVNGARILKAEFAAKESRFARIKQWMSEVVQKLKGLLGMKSDAAILRALDSVLKGDGKFVADAMLSNAKVFNAASQSPAMTPDERADEIIAKGAATSRPVDALVKAVTKAVRIDRATTAIYNKVGALLDRYTPEHIKAGLVSDYGVPDAVIDRRVQMQGEMKGQIRGAGELIDKLATLTRAESRVAYEWMNNNNLQAAAHFEAQLPPESIKVMNDIKELIDKLSQEAVKLGQLDAEAFKRNRFEYLRRSYVKHTAELTAGEAKNRGRAISIMGDQYKGRGMSESVSMNQVKNASPEWWNRKLLAGKADEQLKGERFIRLERRAPNGQGTIPLVTIQGPGNTNPLRKGKLLEVNYWPAGEPVPAKYGAWDQAGTWEVMGTKGGDLIMWRDFSKEERTALGEIDEARYAIAKTLHAMIHDVETGKYLSWLAMKYAAKDASMVTGTLVQATDRMRDSYGKDEWVQVPDSKIPGTSVQKYGLLAGRYLPGPIWNDVRQTVGFKFEPFGETFAAILGAWKTSKTALSPAVHTNNVMANMVMADWHDVTAGHVLKALRLVLAANDRTGEGALGRIGNVAAKAGSEDRDAAKVVMNRFSDSGGNIGTWATAELQKEQLEPLIKALESEIGALGLTQTAQVGTMVAVQKLLQLQLPSAWAAFKPTLAGKAISTEAGNLLKLYEAEDQVFRLAAWLRSKEEGASDLEAGKVARKSFLDYNINAPWIQAARKTVFPFASFTYRAVPMLLETAAKKPWKLFKLGMLAGGLNMLGYLLSGGDEDDERKYMPDEKSGRVLGVVPKLIRMPWNDINGSPVFVDIRRFVPVGDILDSGQSHSAVPLIPSIVPGGVLSIFGELVLNRSQFTGRDITLDTDTAAEKTMKVMDHLYKAFAPNLVILPGTYAFDGVKNASKGKTDAFGREQSTAAAIASTFGVKVGSYPGDVLKQGAWSEAQSKTIEIDRNIFQLKRERQKNGIDQDEFQRKLEVQIEKKREVMMGFQERGR